MRRFFLAVAAIAALAAAPARAQVVYPTPSGQNAPGFVPMCPSGTGTFVPCGSPGARSVPVAVQNNAPDPCGWQTKTTIPIAETSASTFQLIAAGAPIYVCSLSLSIAASATTAASVKFEYGTGTNCGTVGGALSGLYGSNDAAVSTTPTIFAYGGNATIMAAPGGQAFCIVTAGNAVLVGGALSYVQQ